MISSFRHIAVFNYNNKTYELFKNQNEEIAFLKIDNNKYSYPDYQEFKSLVLLFSDKLNTNTSFLKNKSFSPVIAQNINGKIKYIMITSSLVLSILTGCGKVDAAPNFATTNKEYETTTEVEFVDEENEVNIENIINIDESNSELIEELLSNPTDQELLKYNDYQDGAHFNAANTDYVIDEKNKEIVLFNSNYFTEIFGTESYSLEEVYKIIDENENLSEEYKEFFKSYTNAMVNYYGELDLRVYAENLKTLKIEYANKSDFEFYKSGASATYNAVNNTIKLKEGFDFSNVEDLLIIRHEAGHLFNNIIYENADETYVIKFYFNYNVHGKYVKEALDVLFTIKPFESEYEGILELEKGYPIITNIIEVMVDSTDYDIRNSITENIYGFESHINHKSNNNLSVNYIFDIADLLWIDSNTMDFELQEDYYKEVYYYVTNLYLNKNITEDMTEEDINNLKIQLIYDLSKGVKDTSLIQIDAIEDAFNNYDYHFEKIR